LLGVAAAGVKLQRRISRKVKIPWDIGAYTATMTAGLAGLLSGT
jgi:hypothetical protein